MNPQGMRKTKEIVDHCNKCGLCASTCPVYRQLLIEAANPRGRIQLVKYFLDGKIPLSKRFTEIILTCLLCETCVVNCPSGVRHDQVFGNMREELVNRYGLDWKKRLVFNLLTNEKALRSSIIFARLGRNWLIEHFAKGMPVANIPAGRLPLINRKPFRDRLAGMVRPDGEANRRVFYFTGCFTNYFAEDVGAAVVNILKKLNVEIEVPAAQECCGIAAILAGDGNLPMKSVEKNIAILSRAEVDTVLVDCATCGAAFKKVYIDLLRRKGLDTTQAEILKAKTRDVLEYVAERLDELPLPKDYQGEKIRVTYHDPCHLVRAQGVSDAPRKILRALPQVDYVEMEEAGACCGGGGSFQFDFPGVSKGITERKIRHIRETGACCVVTGCPGCRVTIGGNMGGEDRITVLHPMQLLEMALSGKGLHGFAS